jgi:hypothetical protein
MVLAVFEWMRRLRILDVSKPPSEHVRNQLFRSERGRHQVLKFQLPDADRILSRCTSMPHHHLNPALLGSGVMAVCLHNEALTIRRSKTEIVGRFPNTAEISRRG